MTHGGNDARMRHDNRMHDAALLLARVVVGSSIAAHGAQKLFGWFGGPGIEGTTKMFETLGFRPPETMARVASATEILSGVLIATGTAGALGPAMLASVMTAATGSVHLKNGYFANKNGFELNAMYAALALVLAVEDHGSLSVDEITGLRDKMNPLFGWIAIAGGIGASVAMLARREVSTPEKPATSTETGTLGAPASNITPATQ